jgi:hypothetical protein
MTDLVEIALIATIPPTVAAVAGVFVSLSNGRKADLNKIVVDKTSDKVSDVSEKTVEIHALTNSTLSKMGTDLQVAIEKVSGLEKLVSSMQSAKVIADSVAEKISSQAAIIENGH